jgi:Ca2+-binding EF-hand superfamily protein
VLLRKKQPGTPLSIGIAVDLDDSELSRGAQDTHFKDRIWHYCNNDGSFRNGGFQVGTKSQGQKLMYATGDRIDVYFDVDAGELKFAKNGQMLDGVISNIVDKKHLQDIENAKDAGEEPPAGVGNFYLMVSLGSGDFVEVAESPLELTYQYPEATYKWWDREPDNCPSLVAGTPPFFYSVDRELPAGLTIDEKTGIISGIATGKKDIDQAGWRELCIQMYMGKISERGWAKARAALMRELGSNLTDRELKLRSRALFKKFDSDGSGEIDLGELRDAMASIRVILTESELEHMLADLDVDGSASIGMVEFEAVMDKMYNSKEKHSLWKSAGFALKKKLGAQLDVKIELPNKCRDIFKEFDADGSGRIDIGEMCEALGKLGVAVTHDECDEMLDQAGIDQGSGDDVGVDFPSWQSLITMIYTGGDESLWEKAKKGIIEMLGPNLTEEELWDRADKVFAKLDTDKSGYLDLDELGEV